MRVGNTDRELRRIRHERGGSAADLSRRQQHYYPPQADKNEVPGYHLAHRVSIQRFAPATPTEFTESGKTVFHRADLR